MKLSNFEVPKGIAFYSEKPIALSTFADSVDKISQFMLGVEPTDYYVQFEDWYEVDGQLYELQTISSSECGKITLSAQSIFEWMQGERNVFCGLSNELFSWYFRFIASWNQSGSEIQGRFDLVIAREIADAFLEKVASKLETPLQEQDSVEYFKEIFCRYPEQD